MAAPSSLSLTSAPVREPTFSKEKLTAFSRVQYAKPTSQNRLKEKIKDPFKQVIFYELIPPSAKEPPGSIKTYAEYAAKLIQNSHVPIDAINIPEIRDEAPKGQKRTEAFIPKVDARKLVAELYNIVGSSLGFVLNHATVYEKASDQMAWFHETIKTYGIATLILVGGESSKVKYPGPSVIAACKLVKSEFPEILLGGITIPTRRDEPTRLIQKGKEGIEFFTTQVLYEKESICKLLSDYDEACRKEQVTPKRVFLSFAPISSPGDLKFLRWLGVAIPEEVERALFQVKIGVGWRSLEISKTLFQEILNFVESNHLRVPLGLNIEYVTLHNFELSKGFIDELGKIYLGSSAESAAV